MEKTIMKMDPIFFWKHFVEITKIPRCSKHEKKMEEYVKKTAADCSLKFQQDDAGNIVVLKAASTGLEKSRTVILQSHMDMVCEKNEDITHDFSKDPLTLILKGNSLKAKGTTLGGDNAVGLACQLAIMEDKTLKHGKLELLFTVDEETGLTGAKAIKPGFLTGRILINLDSEDLGKYTIGCAGGQDTCGTVVLKFTKTKIENPVLVKLHLKGLSGGHSGTDINKGRANALKLIGRILYKINNAVTVDLASIKGGSRRNVIPRDAFADIIISENELPDFEKIIKELESELYLEYRCTDCQMQLIHSKRKETVSGVIGKKQKDILINLLNCFPNGVLAMSHEVKGLVETSTNLAILKMETDTLSIETSQRSSVETAKKATSDSVRSILNLADFTVSSGSGYPGWKPNPESELVKICQNLNEKYLKRTADIEAIHAGLECGLIGEKFPGMDMISMGPTLKNVHSPNEELLVDTVTPFWKILLNLLEIVAEK